MALWTEAAKGSAVARPHVSSDRLERAAARNLQSPLPALTACLARAGKADEAWTRLEESLARGLLGEWSARIAQPRDADEAKRRQELLEALRQLDEQVLAIPTERPLGSLAADSPRAQPPSPRGSSLGRCRGGRRRGLFQGATRDHLINGAGA